MTENADEYAPPPPPAVPARLPSVAPAEHVQCLLERLEALCSDEDRIRLICEELRGLRALMKMLTGWRAFYAARMWLADVPAHVIAKAAGVTDTYVSKRARDFGYPPRRVDKRRDG